MNDERSSDWGAREREALRSLPRAEIPPSDCEDQIVAALKRKDAFQSRRTITMSALTKVAGVAAAVLLSFLLGTEFGKRAADEPLPESIIPAAEDEGASVGSFASVSWEPDEKMLWPYSGD